MKQTSPWTQYYTENSEMYTIRQHTVYFAWGELMSLTIMYLGPRLGRLLSILSSDKIFAQSLFGSAVGTGGGVGLGGMCPSTFLKIAFVT